jgi:predicted CxxxxCH...CXXCH cytochrome family protein
MTPDRRALSSLCVLAALACHDERARPERPIRFDDVQPLLDRCTPCHGSEQAEAGVRLDTYYETLGCLADGAPLTQSNTEEAPLLSALTRPDHSELLSEAEQSELARWLSADAPGARGVVHGAHILDPRSPDWHGQLAREDAFTPLRDSESDAACGRCHEGAPVRPAGVRFPAPNAPACTSCHTQQDGVLACTTCHGEAGHAYPPRASCYFPAPFAHDAHQTHLSSTRVSKSALPCSTCHAIPARGEVFAGSHADGQIDVRFSALAGAEAEFDPDTHTCSVGCHARGGLHEQPSFHEVLSLRCDGCHRSPPRDHYPGTCDTCHVEMGASANSLTPGALHLNGRVDVGNGDGTCGSCHGGDGDPWPRDDLHRAHGASSWTAPIACNSCHVVPAQLHADGHLNGTVDVQLSGRAVHDAATPSFDAATKRCTNVACHAGALSAPAPDPVWIAPDATFTCTGCHRVPPAPPHIQQPTCGGSLCHDDEVRAAAPSFGITEAGRGRHIDGVVQAGAR